MYNNKSCNIPGKISFLSDIKPKLQDLLTTV